MPWSWSCSAIIGRRGVRRSLGRRFGSFGFEFSGGWNPDKPRFWSLSNRKPSTDGIGKGSSEDVVICDEGFVGGASALRLEDWIDGLSATPDRGDGWSPPRSLCAHERDRDLGDDGAGVGQEVLGGTGNGSKRDSDASALVVGEVFPLLAKGGLFFVPRGGKSVGGLDAGGKDAEPGVDAVEFESMVA